MRLARTAMILSSLVMASAVSLGEAARVVDRAGAVPFDGDEYRRETPTERWAIPFEDRAA